MEKSTKRILVIVQLLLLLSFIYTFFSLNGTYFTSRSPLTHFE